jgi:hypothetical protein
MDKFPCPVCGYKVFKSPPGSYDNCPICGWEDDISQLRFPKSIGANKISLLEAQDNFEKFGAKDQSYKEKIKKSTLNYIRDSKWRKLDPNIDKIEELSGTEFNQTYPEDFAELYYWNR